MGKSLLPQPTVAAEDDTGNEFGRCKVCRENCFRGSSQDLCQVYLRCNVDYQYQTRTFPDTTPAVASEHAAKEEPKASSEQTPGTRSPDTSPAVASEHAATEDPKASPEQTSRTRLPGVLRWLAKRAGAAAGTSVALLSTFAVAMRSSSVADFYATKYLAKPQQWLSTALGPLISGYRKYEEEQQKTETQQTQLSL